MKYVFSAEYKENVVLKERKLQLNQQLISGYLLVNI